MTGRCVARFKFPVKAHLCWWGTELARQLVPGEAHLSRSRIGLGGRALAGQIVGPCTSSPLVVPVNAHHCR